MAKNNLRTLDDIEAEYLQNHPEEIDAYISDIFEEYANDGDTASLLASLRVVVKVKGVSSIANTVGITRQG